MFYNISKTLQLQNIPLTLAVMAVTTWPYSSD